MLRQSARTESWISLSFPLFERLLGDRAACCTLDAFTCQTRAVVMKLHLDFGGEVQEAVFRGGWVTVLSFGSMTLNVMRRRLLRRLRMAWATRCTERLGTQAELQRFCKHVLVVAIADVESINGTPRWYWSS